MTSTLVGNAAQSPAPSSMKAWRVHEFGPPEAMIFETVPRPDPGPGEVLVKVHAAGVGPWDGSIRAGRSALPQPLPLTLGSDLSGEVAALSSGISNMAVGDQVFGVTNTQFLGAYAEYAVASAAMLAKKPSSLSVAASVPVIAVTAWQGLFDQARLEAGQTVVIHGAAGNVGAYAVQLARRARLRSIATAGTKDIDYVRALGADKVVDYRRGGRVVHDSPRLHPPLQCSAGICRRCAWSTAAIAQWSEKLGWAADARWQSTGSWWLEPHSSHRGRPCG
jgi:NADPH:quinone reductase-like Zn-dependent oxidoreductase